MCLPSNIMIKSTITVRRRCLSLSAPTKAGKAHWSVVGQRHALSHGMGIFLNHIAGILWLSSVFLDICYFHLYIFSDIFQWSCQHTCWKTIDSVWSTASFYCLCACGHPRGERENSCPLSQTPLGAPPQTHGQPSMTTTVSYWTAVAQSSQVEVYAF